MFKELPTDKKVRKLIYKELKKLKCNNNIIKNNIISHDKKIEKSDKVITKRKKGNIKRERESFSSILNKKNISNNKNIQKSKTIIYELKNQEKINKNNENYNFSPYIIALREDKRKLFEIIKSYIFDKIEILNLFNSNEYFKYIVFCEYILSLLLDFFFNTLLYSDEIVSHKYHNNGRLQFIVTFILSLLSNIITSIICHYIKISEKLE